MALRPPDEAEQIRRAMLGILEDLQRAEESQRESLRRFESIAQATNDAVWDWDLVENTVLWNETFFSLFGYSRGEIEPGPDSWTARIHPEDQNHVVGSIHAAIQGTGRLWTDEYRFRRRDGTYADILDRGFVVRDASGRALRMTGAMQDVTVRKRTEKEVNRIFYMSPDMICTVSLEGYFQRLNPQFERTLGYSLDELRTAPLYKFIHPDDRAATMREIGRLGAGEMSVNFTNRYQTKNKNILWFEWNAVFLPEDGTIYAIARDISERKSNEEALRKSEKRLRDLIDGLGPSMFIGMTDIDGNLLEANRPALEAAGLKLEDVLGTPVEDTYWLAYSEEAKQEVRESIKRAARGVGSRYDKEVRIAGDRFITLDFSVQPVFDDSGQVAFIVLSGADITHRKLAEEKLRETESRYRLAVQGSGAGIWDWNLVTNRISFAPRIAEILGMAMEELPDSRQAFENLIHPEDRDAVGAAFQAHLAAHTPFNTEYRIRTKSGEYRWLNAQGQALWDQNGKPYRMAGSLSDIQSRKAAEGALQQLNSELENRVLDRTAELAAKNRELESFSYSVSHDLKAPLRGIDGYSQLLQQDYHDNLDEEGRRFLANIRKGVLQMQQMIDDMLAYSKIERRSLTFAPLDLERSLQEILAERRAELAPVQLTIDIVPGSVFADKEGLAIALRNLIDNAVKFSGSRHPPIVDIRSRIEDNRHIISVRDNGTGFEMKHHDNIFKLFQRLHRAEDFPGTGVGLAMVKKAMDRMGGRVWAESVPNQGAVFHLDFQRA